MDWVMSSGDVVRKKVENIEMRQMKRIAIERLLRTAASRVCPPQK